MVRYWRAPVGGAGLGAGDVVGGTERVDGGL